MLQHVAVATRPSDATFIVNTQSCQEPGHKFFFASVRSKVLLYTQMSSGPAFENFYRRESSRRHVAFSKILTVSSILILYCQLRSESAFQNFYPRDSRRRLSSHMAQQQLKILKTSTCNSIYHIKSLCSRLLRIYTCHEMLKTLRLGATKVVRKFSKVGSLLGLLYTLTTKPNFENVYLSRQLEMPDRYGATMATRMDTLQHNCNTFAKHSQHTATHCNTEKNVLPVATVGDARSLRCDNGH